MIKSVKLSPELTKKLVRRGAALSIKRTVANTMASAGLTFENEGDRAFVDSVATLNGNYRMLIYEATQEAVQAGYDPVKSGTLQVYAERGVAVWEDNEPEGSEGEENETVNTEEAGEGTE